MLQYLNSFSGHSVNNLQAAKEFYGNLLGISTKEDMGLELRLTGGNNVFLYEKKDHTPATFTVLNFKVANVEEAVKELKSKGVEFEKYTGELQTDENDIFRGGGPLIAWFKDPAGNILSVLQER